MMPDQSLTYRIIETESDFEPYKCEYNPYLLNVRDEWGLRDIVAEAKKRKLYSLIRRFLMTLKL